MILKHTLPVHNYCTLFDSVYLSRGLAMYESLEKVCKDFHMYIFTFDDLCHSILKLLNLEQATLISLSEFENSRLLEVKQNRTKAEYCWTSTSSTIEYVLNNYNVQSCTYVDADIFFFGSPAVLAQELSELKTVLITEHRYSWLSKIYEEKRAGKFCVQYITFCNEKGSRRVLGNWIDQCIEWCYDRYEDGKFGDQKYLDEWPEKYENIKISDHHGAGVAPWNIKKYRTLKNEESLLGIEKKSGEKFSIIFYHFHFVRFLENGFIDIGWNSIPRDALENLYYPYISKLMEIEENLLNLFPDYKTSYHSVVPVGIKAHFKFIVKRLTNFNLIKYPNTK